MGCSGRRRLQRLPAAHETDVILERATPGCRRRGVDEIKRSTNVYQTTAVQSYPAETVKGATGSSGDN